jgi:hypothetical protein
MNAARLTKCKQHRVSKAIYYRVCDNHDDYSGGGGGGDGDYV